MGGLLIFTSVFVSTVLWASLNIWVITALIVYVALTAVGFRDE
jgi:phospho-N-acetylmuramoyl-pentapeptide-transferase